MAKLADARDLKSVLSELQQDAGQRSGSQSPLFIGTFRTCEFARSRIAAQRSSHRTDTRSDTKESWPPRIAPSNCPLDCLGLAGSGVASYTCLPACRKKFCTVLAHLLEMRSDPRYRAGMSDLPGHVWALVETRFPYAPRAHFTGVLDWQCARCGTINRSTLSPRSWKVSCSYSRCHQTFIPGIRFGVPRGHHGPKPLFRPPDYSFPVSDLISWRSGAAVHSLAACDSDRAGGGDSPTHRSGSR
jgi:hypothetical protein